MMTRPTPHVLTVDISDELDRLLWLIFVNTEVGYERQLVVRRLRSMIDRGATPDPTDVDKYLRSRIIPVSMVRQIVRIYQNLLNGRVVLDYAGQPI